MKEESGESASMFVQTMSMSRPPPHSNQTQRADHVVAPAGAAAAADQDDSSTTRDSTSSSLYYSSDRSFVSSSGDGGDASPCTMSPWHHSAASPYAGSPWNQTFNFDVNNNSSSSSSNSSAAPQPPTCLIGSLVREEGHIYSLATKGELLYTGSDSKNIRVWKDQKEFSGFKSSSGLVKSIIISSDQKIFSGHQDGKIRVWKVSPKDPKVHKRAGSLPRLRDFIKCSLKPSNYVETHRRRRNSLWIRHYDAISCLSLNEDQGLLYSGSWDKTFKVWRMTDFKCLESVNAHDDAVNSVVATGFDGLVFTGSADGTVKVWKRELQAKGVKHMPVQTLLEQESAVTALAVSPTASVIYSGSSDGLINMWEWEIRNHLSHGGVLRGHKLAVLCLVAKGSLLLSGSADKTICVWRREGAVHTCFSVLSGHGGPVKCLAMEEDPNPGPHAAYEHNNEGVVARYIVYSGSLDKSVKVWRVSEKAPEVLLHGPQIVPEV